MILPGILSSQISGHLFTLTGSYDALSTVTVPSGGASSITFSAIPQTGYKHLQLRIMSKSTNAGGYSLLRPNGDSTYTNFYWHYLSGNGTSAGAGNSQSSGLTGVTLNNTLVASSYTNMFAVSIVDILDYANTNKNKTFRSLEGYDTNSSNGNIGLDSSLWLSTAAINSITIVPSNDNFAQYSQFSLYGVK
jgi:hypothetical protein